MMTSHQPSNNRVKECRIALGLTQAELAGQAGISRTAVTAIEGNRLTPSVEAALALAKALATNVETLFSRQEPKRTADIWAAPPRSAAAPCWEAEVNGRTILYPADTVPMFTMVPDRSRDHRTNSASSTANETLVIACCDPAAGLLASQYARATGLRLVVLQRSSQEALEMLRSGFVHLAGLHLSTRDNPDKNVDAARRSLGNEFGVVRMAQWQSGIVLAPAVHFRSVRAVIQAKLSWVGRQPGSGARQCLDRLLENRPAPRRIARDHRGVAEAVQFGWADAGVCVRLVSEETGLKFLPVQDDTYDVCYRSNVADDRRVKAFVNVVRSKQYRSLLGDLPGYDTRATGEVWDAGN